MDRVIISVRCVGSRMGYTYYAAGLYRAVPRKRDGVTVWRLVGDVSRWHRSPAACLRDLHDSHRDTPVGHARHNFPVEE